MIAGLFATVAMTHVGPLTESPVTARAASVPNAPVRFWMKPAPSFSSMVARSRPKSGSDLVICAVNSWNSCKGSRVET
jgi:hypothetical protein